MASYSSKKGLGSSPKKDIKEDKSVTYEFDGNIDLETLINDELNNLDLEEEFQKVLQPVETQIKHIERRTRDIDKIFADATEQMMIFKKAIEEQQFVESSSESSSDQEIVVDDDDDVQFITATVNPERRKTQGQAIKTLTSGARLVSSGQQVVNVSSAQGSGTTQFVQAKYIRIMPGQGQQASHIESTAIVQRRIPFYRTLKRPIPNELVCGMKLLGKKINDIWYKGTLVEIGRKDADEKYVIKFDGKGKKALSGKQIALWDSAETMKLPLGTRVVAMYKDEDALPAISHYAGVVAEPPSIRNLNRYLIFFDDGYAQYNEPKTVHQVFEQSFNVWEDIHPDSSEFIKSYLEQYPERPMVRLQKGQMVKTEWMGKWWTARVVEVDASLVKMFFDADKRTEWIYRGTTRLEPLYTELANAESQKAHGKARRHTMGMKRSNKPYVEYTRGMDVEDEGVVEKVVPSTPPTPSSPSADPGLAMYQPSGIQQQTARKSTASRAVAKKSTMGRQVSYEASSSIIKKEFKPQPTCTIKKEPYSYSPSSKEKSRKLQDYDEGEHHGEQFAKHMSKIAPLRKERKAFTKHRCGRDCVRDEDDPFKFKGQNPLLIPMLCGWERHIAKVRASGGGTSKRHVYYRAPCGRTLRLIEEVDEYLIRTDSKVTIDWFCYDPASHPFNEFVPVKTFCDIKDLSYGKENVPISCVNGIDRQYPEYVEYSNQRFPAKGVKLNLDSDFLVCCDCTDGCRDKSKCACCQLTINATLALPGVKMGDPSAGYEYRRIKEPNITGIYECNQKCKCDYRCANRVAQHGLQHRLQVFKTDKKGWGLRCLDDIPQGGFICIYAGQVLTDEDANEDGHQYGDEYLAELDHIEVVERFKEGYEEDAIDPVESGEEEEDEEKDENVSDRHSDSTYSAGGGSEGGDSGVAPGRYSTRKRTKRKQSKDDDAKGVGKLLIRRSSAEGKAKNSWSIQSVENEQQTAEWVSKIPDKVGDDADDSKDPAFAMDTDELPDLVPGSGKSSGKKDGISGLRITEPTSLNTDNIDSDDSDESPMALKRTKAEISRFSNLPDPKNKTSGGKQKDTKSNDDNEYSTQGLRSYFGEEFCYIMDAKSIGNIGRYLNHSCTPNVFVQNVFVDTHDLRFPWVAFFALTYIRAGTEMTWDYNYEVGSVPGKVLYCYCGSADCRGRLL
ncbi:histone-lysine N-methyltransferase eggless-like isoform X2 [Lineus longissimus]|uniref:histone-lysine N-methyltransferase eggless-like isoform X2 n=1 Tax=Lineus longissimus TaxID=88925 RepID=UPI00315D596B